MGSGHSHHSDTSTKRLYWAIAVNVLLTVVQIIGGLLSGSLSLIADALHNFSDAGALFVAALAKKIARLPATEKMTFGYKRAEILGALINSTTLLLVGGYLIYESIIRFSNPEPIKGWTVIWVAGVALVVDIFTAMLTYKGSKENINFKAAFIHNVSDALASVVVIVAGTVIVWFEFYLIDLIATLLISVYIIFHAVVLVKQCILILMQGIPDGMNLDEIKKSVLKMKSVEDLHHVHLWQLDDKSIHFEAHIVVSEINLFEIEALKKYIRKVLREEFKVSHSTLEIEFDPNGLNKCSQVDG